MSRSLNRPTAVLQIDLLRDRNLAAATFMIMAFGIGMMSTIVLQPIFLEHLLGYPASTAGLVMAPRGIAVAVGMASVAVLINRIEPRLLVLAGLTLAAAGSYAMTWYNLDIDLYWIILPGIVQGIGMGMIFVPLSTLAYQTLAGRSDRPGREHFQSRAHHRRLDRHRHLGHRADAREPGELVHARERASIPTIRRWRSGLRPRD